VSDDTNPRAPVQERRSKLPHGRTYRFVEAVRAEKGEAFVVSWLTLCQFTECVVWTNEDGRKRVNRECGDLIKQHGVVIRADEESRAFFQHEAQALFSRAVKPSASKPRRQR
jgi:hypothetical protein